MLQGFLPEVAQNNKTSGKVEKAGNFTVGNKKWQNPKFLGWYNMLQGFLPKVAWYDKTFFFLLFMIAGNFTVGGKNWQKCKIVWLIVDMMQNFLMESGTKWQKEIFYNHQAHLVPELDDYSNLEKFLIGFFSRNSFFSVNTFFSENEFNFFQSEKVKKKRILRKNKILN